MDVEEICSGWLTKSPSSKYVTLFSRGKISIRVPLKSKWRRRYFVLHKPHGSLPHQYAFDYFKDEHDSRRRGTINLEECESILSELDSSHYPNLFSIKTKARDKDRVYYLAAETDDDMLRWVTCLCSLCDLKMGPTTDVTSLENHTVAPNPPVRHDSIQLTVDLPVQKALSNQSLVDEELSNQILEEIEAIEQGRVDIDSRPISDRVPMGYTELAECSTGESTAPANCGEFIELYDVPKAQRLAPPTRFGQSQSVRSRPSKPVTEGIASSRSANSSPRFARTLPNRSQADDPLPPPRPPKPGQPVEELYQNVSSHNSPLLLRGDGAQVSPGVSRLHSNQSLNTSTDRFVFPATLSPAVNRRTDSNFIKSNGRVSPARNFSVDSVYHNTAALACPTNGANHNELAVAQTRKEIDGLYDIPKSFNISAAIPAPPPCSSNMTQTVHKYVNASAGIITRPLRNGERQQSPDSLQSATGEDIELNRQSVDHNHYDLSPGSGVVNRPTRPPKPRNLSDPAVLEAGEDDALYAGHHVLKVSKSFRTRAFTKDNVFSDSEESPHTCNREEIKLPSRINTNDSSSSSNEADSSSEDEFFDEELGEPDAVHGGRVESVYEVPPAPRPVQPGLPVRLHHNRTLNHTQTLENIAGTDSTHPSHVKRSSSMSKVAFPQGSMSKLSAMGSASPKLLKNNHHPILRSERSSSVCATDWRNRPMNTALGLQQVMPKPSLRAPPELVHDIQYVELDQSDDRSEPSPKPSRASLSSMIPAAGQAQVSELEYTDIDLLKTQALTVTRKERDMNLRKRSENME